LANGGTLFLDEIGELLAEAQVKLLRVLQEHEFDRVGGTTPIRVDVRVIAATNRDLLKEVQEKRFREDLYYRLNVFPVRLPPLRQRQDDIPMLVHFLVNKFATRVGKRLEGVSRETMQRLQDYPWPGNIRELENVLERAVILATGPTLEVAPDLLPTLAKTHPNEEEAQPEGAGDAPIAAAAQQAPSQPLPRLEAVERDYIITVLRHTNWVITGPRGAATVLGLNPSTLRSRIKKLGISRDRA
jgi:transcriptional regulator with GAF, ATPase, and Fis domain